jgi:hypothetical protein
VHFADLLQKSSVARNVLMSEEEYAALIDRAYVCDALDCTYEDVDALIVQLKEQQQAMSTRLQNIMNVIAHLQHANDEKERNKEDVRKIVKDMLRVFTNVDGGFAMGFSGDIGKGATTAYDALPPKPWKGAP